MWSAFDLRKVDLTTYVIDPDIYLLTLRDTWAMSFKSIPILDLALASDPATKPSFLANLRHALLEVGFLYIKNVGIPDELFQRVVSEGRAFFDIPLEEK